MTEKQEIFELRIKLLRDIGLTEGRCRVKQYNEFSLYDVSIKSQDVFELDECSFYKIYFSLKLRLKRTNLGIELRKVETDIYNLKL